MNYIKILILSGAIFLNIKLNCQIDCASPSGIFALTAAPVVINNTDIDDATSSGGPLIVQGQTKIFLNPPSTIPSSCFAVIKMYVFYSLSQSEINSLPALSQQNLNNLDQVFQKSNIRATISNTSDPNLKNCSVNIPRVGLLPTQVIHYRWAKLIEYPGGPDPLIWSSAFSFTVTSIDLFNLKFDIELKLDHLVVRNAPVEIMALMGEIRFESLKAFGRGNSTRKKLWPLITINGADRYREGSHPGRMANIRIIENLSFDELRNIELRVGGYLGIKDERIRPIHSDLRLICDDCSQNKNEKDPFFNKSVFYRILKFADFPTTQTSIYNLQNNQKFQPLKFGEDSLFELNWFWELSSSDEKKEYEWVTFYFKVLVKPHQ